MAAPADAPVRGAAVRAALRSAAAALRGAGAALRLALSLTLGLLATWPAPGRAAVPAGDAVAARLADALGAAPTDWATLQRADALSRRCDQALQGQARATAELIRRAGQPGVDVLSGYGALSAQLEDRLVPLGFLAQVHPRPALRRAAEACQLRLQTAVQHLHQSPRLLAALRSHRPADAVAARLRDDLLRRFEDAGAALPPPRRAEARRLREAIARTELAFERSLREGLPPLAFHRDELDGLPPALWQDAPRDRQGRVLLGFDAVTADELLARARRPATRERYWRAWLRSGGEANLQRLRRLLDLRRQQAALFGAASPAHWVLRGRMAGQPETVAAFLDRLEAVLAPLEAADLAELQALQRADPELPPRPDGRPPTLARWDLAYYAERRQRQRHPHDPQALRRHFPPEASLQLMFALAEHSFGLRFEPLALPLWHPDARAWRARDRDTGAARGLLYTDLHPREGKYGHFAVFPLRSAAPGRQAAAALVANLGREGLRVAELETLLHEFGHVLHMLLATPRHLEAGALQVPWDFVEAPSQMLEGWVEDPRVLGLLRSVCPRCEPPPPDALAAALAAHRLDRGRHTARQLLLARYDLLLHGPRPEDPLALWRRLEGATPLGHAPDSLYPASFEHLAGAYAAGYYGYLWSQVLAADLDGAWAGDRLDPRVGRRWRDTVLAPGNQQAPEQLIEAFLGRPAGEAAFLRWLAPAGR